MKATQMELPLASTNPATVKVVAMFMNHKREVLLVTPSQAACLKIMLSYDPGQLFKPSAITEKVIEKFGSKLASEFMASTLSAWACKRLARLANLGLVSKGKVHGTWKLAAGVDVTV